MALGKGKNLKDPKKGGEMKKLIRLVIGVSLLVMMLTLFQYPSFAEQQLPDLQVADIYLDQFCFPYVAIANRSPVGFRYHSSALLLLYLDGNETSPWFGGEYFDRVDPRRFLSHPYGSVTYQVPKAVPRGSHRIKAKIIVQKDGVENDSMNSLEKTLVCNRHFPDLVIEDIRAVTDSMGNCLMEIIIKNQGGEIPASELDRSNLYVKKGEEFRIYYFSHSDLSRYCGVSHRGLLRPGGRIVVYPDGKPDRYRPQRFCVLPKGGTTVTAWIDSDLGNPYPYAVVAESNETNNKKTKRLYCIPAKVVPLPEKVRKPKVIKLPVVPGTRR